ncbi:hypothetical protein HII36_08805 [Nonomuraea sp. NN258]|uniref:hypothetical protein n=1 Tax=Nonomuraea antri TaxID=2730852 RepID=UPI0015696DFC|nr:hypothetical protein [Nonomuraea antri]NRQ31938.1 hypothetical protein [Nonomuraea antri]
MADELTWTDGGVVYTFPIEVEVIGELGEAQLKQVTDHVFAKLDAALKARG